MNFLSLDFFKSERRKELERLQVEEQRIKNDVLRQQLSTKDEGRQYRQLKLVNDVLTVVLNDGSILSKPYATVDDFDRVVKATSYQEILTIIASPEVVEEMKKAELEKKKAVALQEGVKLLSKIPDFEVKGNSVYLRGTNRSLPQLLVEEFVGIAGQYMSGTNIELWRKDLLNDTKYQALKRFFMWCCLNPRAEVADKLYEFLTKNSFRITKQGFFTALRNVVSVNSDDSELVHFISNAYNKVKAVWKKKPCEYDVYEDGEYTLIKKGNSPPSDERFIGNLQDLYIDLPDMRENRFTDAHTHTFDIRVGQPVNMAPEQCSWSTADCAEAGLHFTADQIHYVGCGDTSVLVLINPMKVVGIGESKGRCYEYLPIMTVPREEATTLLHDLDFDTLELDEDYAIRELDSLEEKVKDGFAKEATKHEFNIPSMSSKEIDNIVLSLKEMEKEISKRVSVIK